MSTHTLELDQVSKRFPGVIAVNQVSFTVAEGERVALLGHNGAGKTTLMKLMLGLVRPSGGRLTVLGQQPGSRAAAALRRRIGFLPENVAFHNVMTGLELLHFYARLKDTDAAEAGTLLERVGLAQARGTPVRGYSRGMRQRLGLAQALLGEPRLLLLDEPTAGLDPHSRQHFYAIVRELAAAGVSVLLSSHLLTELEERTDRILIMDRGRLVASGSLDALRAEAGLELQIVVTTQLGRAHRVAAGVGGCRASRLLDAGTLSIRCRAADKMEILQRIVQQGPLVRDVEIEQPSLDDVYAHFVGPEQPV